MTKIPYIGKELETFAQARNWKAYLRAMMGPYILGDVLEVGAGLGATTMALQTGTERSWTCLEPDPLMADGLRGALGAKNTGVRVVTGTLKDLPDHARFDTILYVDVLEHIEDDRSELRLAAGRLRPAGQLLVMSPAHQFLYSPFDAEIGHFRRYNVARLCAISPAGLALRSIIYLDAAGLLLSTANRLLLRSRMPTHSQVLTWDRWFVPISRRLDPWLRRRIGKSILAVWRLPGA